MSLPSLISVMNPTKRVINKMGLTRLFFQRLIAVKHTEGVMWPPECLERGIPSQSLGTLE